MLVLATQEHYRGIDRIQQHEKLKSKVRIIQLQTNLRSPFFVGGGEKRNVHNSGLIRPGDTIPPA